MIFFAAKTKLSWVFGIGLLSHFIVYLLSIVFNKVHFSEFLPLMLSALKVYAIPGAFVFSIKLFEKGNRKVKSSIFWIIFLVSVLWNCILLYDPVLLFFKKVQVEDVQEYQRTIAEYSSFLIGGFLSYFFSASER